MRPATFLAAFLGSWPLTLAGFTADEASRPTPPPATRTEHPVRDEADDGAVKAGEDQVLLPALRGLAVGTAHDSALRLQSLNSQGLQMEGFSGQVAPAIQRVATDAIGKPVSLRSLDRLGKKLEGAISSAGQPFMLVTFPPQEITSGVIAVVIRPAHAGRVLIAGKPAFGLQFAANEFRTRPGDLISDDRILEDLAWLNENPLRRASISYADGAADGTLDLTLRIKAARNWRVYGGIDNRLSDELGGERMFLGAQYGDLFGLDHRITAQYTAALDFDKLQGISGIYEMPLPNRGLLEISGGYTESETDGSGPIDQSGKFSRLALGYRIALPRCYSIAQELRIGLEFRNNEYAFTDGTSQAVRFFDLAAGWHARRNDRYGSTGIDLSLSCNPGHGILGSNDEDYIALGASGAESLIAKIELERSLKLGGGATLFGRMLGQWSDQTLLSSDQLAAGGINGVRGFDETVAFASSGIVGSLELQSPFQKIRKAGSIQEIAFIDAAFLNRDVSTEAGQLASVGLGLRWRFSEMLNSRLDLGIPIDRPSDINGGPRLHFSVGANW